MAFPTNSADLELSSSQEFTAIDSTSLSITGNISAEAWIKIESLVAGDVHPVIAKNDAGTSRNWIFHIQDVGSSVFRLSFGVDQTGNNTLTAAASGGTDMDVAHIGVWTHVGANWTAGITEIPHVFINGVDDGQNNTTVGAISIADSNIVTRIGRQGATIRFFDGRIVLARVWSSVRSATDFSNNWCTNLGTTTNLAAEWTLDNTLNDNSGNANTLTNVNTVTFGVDTPATCAVVAIKSSSLLLMGVG